jgi:hypothetical protein
VPQVKDAYAIRYSTNPASPEGLKPMNPSSRLHNTQDWTTTLRTQTSVPQRHAGAWRPELERTPADDDNNNARSQADGQAGLGIRHPHTSTLMYRITCALLARLLLRRGRGSPSRAQTVGTNGQRGTWRALEGTETHWLLFSLSPWKTDAAKVAFSVFVVLVRLDG